MNINEYCELDSHQKRQAETVQHPANGVRVGMTPVKTVTIPDDDFDERDEYEDDDYEEWGKCSCPRCYCHNDTEYGEVCNDCLAGAHQG